MAVYPEKRKGKLTPHTFRTEEEYAEWVKRLHESATKLTLTQKEALFKLALNPKPWSERRGG